MMASPSLSPPSPSSSSSTQPFESTSRSFPSLSAFTSSPDTLSSSSSPPTNTNTNTNTLLPSSSPLYSSDVYRTPLQPHPQFHSDSPSPSPHRHRHRRGRHNRSGPFSCCFCRGRCCGCGLRTTVTIVSNLLSLLPMFVGFGLMGAAHLSYGYTNLTNIFIALLCLGLDYLLKYRRLIRVFPKQLAVANPFLSTLCTILAFTTSDVLMKRWSGFISVTVLTAMIIIGYLTRHPLKLEQYQDLVPLSIWNSPTHRATLYDLGYRSTFVYIYAFTSLTVFSLVTALLSHCPEDGNCDIFGQTWLHLLVGFLAPFVIFGVAHRHMSKTIPTWQVACGYDEEVERQKKKERRRREKLERKRNGELKEKSEEGLIEMSDEQKKGGQENENEEDEERKKKKKKKEQEEEGQYDMERVSVLVHGDYLRKDSTEEEQSDDDDYDDDEEVEELENDILPSSSKSVQ